jgi:hypothetical protein
MKTAGLLKFRLIASTSIVASLLLFASCDEKKSEPINKTKTNTSGSGEEGEGEEGEGEEGEGEGTEAGEGDEFDLCKDGLKAEKKLSSWSSLVEELCDDGKLKDLRKSSNVFRGGDPIVSNKSDKESLETNIVLYSSSQYSATVDDYWSLVRLQTTDPEEFRALKFKYDENVDMADVSATSSASSYRYTNDPQDGSRVDYKAKTTYITLKKGQAYVAATAHVEKIETMKALKGLIIVNKLGENKVEVFTISDQTYEHKDGESDTVETRVLSSLKKEQKNSFENSKTAEKATEALK